MVDEAVGDARLVGDVRHAAACGSPGGRRRAPPRRGSGGACRRRLGGARRRPSGVRPRAGGGWPATAACARISSWRVEVEVGDRRRSRGRAPARARRPTGRRSSSARRSAWPRRVLADLVGGDHEALVLDRARAQQDLPVVARRRQRERGRDGEHARAARPRARGRAPGSAGRSRRSAPARRRPAVARRTTSSPGVLVLGLAVLAAADLDVEHVQLAVDRAVGRRRGRRARRCCGFARPSPRSAIEPATRSMPSSRAIAARPRQRRAVERLGAGGGLLRRAEHGPLLRAGRRAAPRRRRPRARAGPPPRGCASRSGVEFSWMAAARARPSPPGLTGQSTPGG